jgi:DUF917 family protein
MPSGRLRTAQDVEDFVRGCTFFGTGGGGIPESGTKALLEELDAGALIGWIDPAEIPDDALVASAFFMGSVAPPTPQEQDELDRLGLKEAFFSEKEMLLQALEELGEHLRKPIFALVPPEIGAANGPGPLAVGAHAKLFVVDGDYAGRSVPEVQCTTFCLERKKLWPLACVDRFGNVTVIKRAASVDTLEKLARFSANATYGLSGQASFVLSGKEMKETVIPGTLTLSHALGRFIRESRKRSQDVARLITAYIEGWLLIEGNITRKEEKKTAGYLSGAIDISDGRRKLTLWFKNETHLASLDGKAVAMSPDIVSVLRAGSGEPTIHAQLNRGDEVSVIGARAPRQLRTNAGLAAMGPRHWGYDFDYVPIEELVKRNLAGGGS